MSLNIYQTIVYTKVSKVINTWIRHIVYTLQLVVIWTSWQCYICFYRSFLTWKNPKEHLAEQDDGLKFPLRLWVSSFLSCKARICKACHIFTFQSIYIFCCLLILPFILFNLFNYKSHYICNDLGLTARNYLEYKHVYH